MLDIINYSLKRIKTFELNFPAASGICLCFQRYKNLFAVPSFFLQLVSNPFDFFLKYTGD